MLRFIAETSLDKCFNTQINISIQKRHQMCFHKRNEIEIVHHKNDIILDFTELSLISNLFQAGTLDDFLSAEFTKW